MTTIIGIDCATNPKKVGLARAVFSGGETTVHEVCLGSTRETPADIAGRWIEASEDRVLLALDAPLGWPQPLAETLHTHRAGAPLHRDAHTLFRRETDRFVKATIGKQSLDVGADRIARTGHSALGLLADLGARLGAAIPLAWDAEFAGVAAIEVYPAATLRTCGIDATGYKKPDGQNARRRVADALGAHLNLVAERDLLHSTDDALDAVVCTLAGQDLLTGIAMPPPNLPLALHEGWIWVRPLDLP